MRLSLPLVLVGLPGAGKSKVGRLLARSLGVDHVDTDALIEAEAGKPVSEIFASEGEAVFRALEVRAVEKALASRAVVSLGGGAVTSEPVRALLRGASVVRIDVDHEELVRRVSRKSHRPLLREDPDGSLRRLRAEREPYYAEVESVRIHSDDGPAWEVAERIAALVDLPWTPIRVEGAKPYEVLVGRGIPASAVRSALRPEATKALIVHAAPLEDAARALAVELESVGLEVRLATHPDGESAKTLEVVSGLWDLAGEMRLGRADAVVAIGGGATTDMAGFVAATWLRGLDLVTVPTTLLAMVDAAVGGKTGINAAAGKNLIGSFHPPVRVICDLDRLTSLPEADFRAGMGEVVKCGFIADEEILRIVETHDPAELVDPASPAVRELVERAVAVKARVVSADLEESGLREILNYGHTLAHAIEKCEHYTWRHGEAVAVGCVFAARLAQARGLLDEAAAARHIAAFSRMGLPTSYDGAPLDDLLAAMLSDKKVRAGRLRFVLLDGLQNPKTHRVDPAELEGPARMIGVRA
ncbi:3-dehydroquinate synthase [Actinomyces culturomici]|uniref:3-dehydroquinate synthase n=1 Tax=Actinomyces culturomici TaxID=1926276 RepID=UPI000E20568F|nr:3-dehydroquinate synthase [Actinomyces culturomici]